jgi:soluble lytic murein transglycosylase-like protein
VSAQAVSGAAAGELAAAQRVQQLQALIESARQVAAGGVVATASPSTAASPTAASSSGYTSAAGYPSAGADFASALQAATGAGASSALGAAATSALGTAGTDALSAYSAYSPLTQSAAGEAGGQYESLIAAAAARNGLDPAVLHGLIEQESGFDPSATSGAGASGLTQLMPGTASSLGVADPLNPAESIEGGARYLGQMMERFGGNTEDALAAYNAGPGAVEQYGGVPPYAETQSYVGKVLGYAESYRQSHPTTVTGAIA